MFLSPLTPAELADAVRATPRVLAIGAGTKPRLSRTDATPISTRALSGIVEYEPSEFTFTALAGTPVREIAAALAKSGQYLPFDPLLVDAGSTLGGTVASGLSGPGRFRYGGLRDFILGVQFVDGEGRLLRMGGKVVKNAAGFDLPKFFVGSLGRYGVLAEITFKVFPRAAAFRTVRIPTDDVAATMMSMSSTRWELDALDAADGVVFARVGGPAAALDALTTEMLSRFPSGAVLAEDAAFWTSVREFSWAHPDGVLVKIALTPKRLPALCAAIGDARIHVSAGGNVAYVSQPAFSPCFSGFDALTLRGDAPLFPGIAPVVVSGVKTALDPQNRFPSL
ncbi:MAG: FAD-binding protein [Chthoniobacteraceae bacterium]